MAKKAPHFPKDLELALKKAGMRLQRCSENPLAPDQKRQIDAADEAVRDYLVKLDKAYKLSRNSKSTILYAQKTHTR